MALYREGKAAMAADGTVTGTGTKWQSSLSLIRPGATIMFLSSPIQMAVVNKVVSDTEIKAITTNGAVVASTDYAILLSDSLTVDGLAQDVAETLRYYQSQETVIADAVEFFKEFDFESLQNLANQIKADSEAAEDSATAAAASESAAKTSETNAKESENAAKTSEVAAETARDQVQQIINDAGEQSTLVVLAQPDGVSKVYNGKAPLVQTLPKYIFSYLNDSDRATLLSTVGAKVDCDYALKDAIADGVMTIILPRVKGRYVFGNSPATLPSGFYMIGEGCFRPYNPLTDSAFNDCGVVIEVAAGKTFPFYSNKRHVFRDIVFNGRDRTTYLLYSTNSSEQFNGTRFEGCGIYNFAVGLGWSGYTGTLFATRCSVSGNVDGVRNLIDSNLVACVINANNRGVALTGGSNNNNFEACRNEWNTTDNYYAYESVENTIVGELCDRAGRGGVVAGKDGQWIVTGVNVRRCGANQTVGNDYSANFIIIDNGKLQIGNVRTGKGANDSGDGGTTSPSFNVSILGAGGGTLLISGSDMTGFVTSAINQKASTVSKSITGCLGVNDDVNVGMNQVVNGRRIIGTLSSGILAASAGATLSVTKTNILQGIYDTYITRAILIECRIGSSAQSDYIKIPVGVRHENNFYLDVITSGIVANSGRIGLSGTGVTVSLSISATDGAITVLLTSVDGLARTVNVSLLQSM